MAEPAATFTPGPWRVIQPIALDYRAPLVYGPNAETLIATAEGGGPRRAIDARESRANAFLIAAAPDLYEALEDIIEQYEASRIMVGADLADSISVFGKTALAKARGEQP